MKRELKFSVQVRLLLQMLGMFLLGVVPADAAIPQSAHLHTQGRMIVDPNGKVVRLVGVNIGGWLVTEGWMCGQTDDGGRGALEQLETRFGPKKAAVLMNAWYDNWLTTADLDLIRSWGCNVLRVPFGWRNLQNADGSWRRNGNGEIDFSRMDWILTQAADRDMFVIFDLHIWPRQFEKDKYGLPSRWDNQGKAVRAKMSTLWTEVARHYKGDGRIAAFDVINEPEGSPYNAPHHAFTDAIRKQDPGRMIIVEWSGYANMPKEFPINAIYSDHYAFNDQPSLDKYVASLAAHPEVNVPVYLGEMKAGQDTKENARWMADAMLEHGWNWTIWTYKGVDNGGWAGVNYDREMKYNLAADSYEDILKKWKRFSAWRYAPPNTSLHLTQWWIDGFGADFKKVSSTEK